MLQRAKAEKIFQKIMQQYDYGNQKDVLYLNLVHGLDLDTQKDIPDQLETLLERRLTSTEREKVNNLNFVRHHGTKGKGGLYFLAMRLFLLKRTGWLFFRVLLGLAIGFSGYLLVRSLSNISALHPGFNTATPLNNPSLTHTFEPSKTPILTPTYEATIRASKTAIILPISTITVTPTFTPKWTPSLTPSSTPTLQPYVELLLPVDYRTTGIGCQVDVKVSISGATVTGNFHVRNDFFAPGTSDTYPQTNLPTGTYYAGTVDVNNLLTLGGDQPAYYQHEIWFEYNGGNQSNHLTGVICSGVP